MKHLRVPIALLLLAAGCRPTSEDLPTPVAPQAITVSPDSVELNPFGFTPLVALVHFTTPTAGNILVRVRGKNGRLTNVEHIYSEEGNRHILPVAGLYPNYANTVDLRLLSERGDTTAQGSVIIQTGDLPPNMPTAITAASVDEARVTPGLTLVSNFSTRGTDSPSTPFFMDAYGDIRWVLDYRSHDQLKTLSYDDGISRLRNGHFFFSDQATNRIYEVDLMGQVLRSWSLNGYTFHHEVMEKPNGNFLVTVSKPGSTNTAGGATVEDYVIEIDRTTGRTLTVWDLKQSLDENRTAWQQDIGIDDWFHGNAVLYDSTDNTIVVSGRHQGVVKLDNNNRVKWILGSHRGWTVNRRGEQLNKFLLQPVDASGRAIADSAVADGSKNSPDFEWNWYQHDPSFLPNGSLILFDNGDIRNYEPAAPKYSRAVAYRIDPVKMTVQQVWAYGKERGADTFSSIISSAQFLPGSNHVLFGPGYQVPNQTGLGGKVVEIDAGSKQVVSEISISSANGFGFHRAKKMPLYP